MAFTGNIEAEYVWYESADGGITWNGYRPDSAETWPSCERESPPWEVSDPLNESIHWRITDSSKFIEQSTDAGETWHKIYEFPQGDQVRKYYYRPDPQNFGPHSRVIHPGGPYNGVVDKSSGNLIVSMGFEGVLVVTRDGEAKRVAVGPYGFIDIHQLSIEERLHAELFLTLWLACLIPSILSIPLWSTSRFRSLYVGGTIIGIIFWLLFSLLSKEVGMVDLLETLLVFIKGWSIYLVLAVAGSIVIVQERSWRLIGFVLVTIIISAVLFMMPLLFWANGKIPVYQIAIIISLLMVALLMRYSYRWIRAQRYR